MTVGITVRDTHRKASCCEDARSSRESRTYLITLCYLSHCYGCAGHLAHPPIVHVHFFVFKLFEVDARLFAHSARVWYLLFNFIIVKVLAERPTVDLRCWCSGSCGLLFVLSTFSLYLWSCGRIGNCKLHITPTLGKNY